MTPEAFHAAALVLPGATYDIKWGEDRVYSVGGKMFATAGSTNDPAPCFAFKCSELGFEMLIEQGFADPSPYLARAKWVKLKSPDALSDEALVDYLKEAHRIVASGLTKKVRTELGL